MATPTPEVVQAVPPHPMLALGFPQEAVDAYEAIGRERHRGDAEDVLLAEKSKQLAAINRGEQVGPPLPAGASISEAVGAARATEETRRTLELEIRALFTAQGARAGRLALCYAKKEQRLSIDRSTLLKARREDQEQALGPVLDALRALCWEGLGRGSRRASAPALAESLPALRDIVGQAHAIAAYAPSHAQRDAELSGHGFLALTDLHSPATLLRALTWSAYYVAKLAGPSA